MAENAQQWMKMHIIKLSQVERTYIINKQINPLEFNRRKHKPLLLNTY